MIAKGGYTCDVWSNAGGVTILSDGVGDGDKDTEGVGIKPVECNFPDRRRKKEGDT